MGFIHELRKESGVRCLIHPVKTRDRLVWLFHGILIFQHLSTIQLSLALACFPNNEGGIRFNRLRSNRDAALPDPIIPLPGDDEPGIKFPKPTLWGMMRRRSSGSAISSS